LVRRSIRTRLLNELNSTQDENLKGEIEAQLDYRKEKGE